MVRRTHPASCGCGGNLACTGGVEAVAAGAVRTAAERAVFGGKAGTAPGGP